MVNKDYQKVESQFMTAEYGRIECFFCLLIWTARQVSVFLRATNYSTTPTNIWPSLVYLFFDRIYLVCRRAANSRFRVQTWTTILQTRATLRPTLSRTRTIVMQVMLQNCMYCMAYNTLRIVFHEIFPRRSWCFSVIKVSILSK